MLTLKLGVMMLKDGENLKGLRRSPIEYGMQMFLHEELVREEGNVRRKRENLKREWKTVH
jgi:hypothetical protein